MSLVRVDIDPGSVDKNDVKKLSGFKSNEEEEEDDDDEDDEDDEDDADNDDDDDHVGIEQNDNYDDDGL